MGWEKTSPWREALIPAATPVLGPVTLHHMAWQGDVEHES